MERTRSEHPMPTQNHETGQILRLSEGNPGQNLHLKPGMANFPFLPAQILENRFQDITAHQ